MITFVQRWLRGRKQLLNSTEAERAFAPDPNADFWPLDTNRTNEKAYDFIREGGIALVRASNGESADLLHFNSGLLHFATTWESYSAMTIGSLKRSVDGGRTAKFGIVLFEETREGVAQRKAEAWYYPNIWTLASASADLKPLIARVPFQIFIGADGKVEHIVEGKV